MPKCHDYLETCTLFGIGNGEIMFVFREGCGSKSCHEACVREEGRDGCGRTEGQDMGESQWT